jgi:hypothetical protein
MSWGEIPILVGENFMAEEFVLTLSRKQAKVLVSALDLFSRIGLGQLEEVEQVAQRHGLYTAKPGKETPSSSEHALIRRWLAELKMLIYGFEPNASFGIFNPRLPAAFKISHDLEQVIRHKLAWTANPKGGSAVDFCEPLISSNEPLAKMEVKK